MKEKTRTSHGVTTAQGTSKGASEAPDVGAIAVDAATAHVDAATAHVDAAAAPLPLPVTLASRVQEKVRMEEIPAAQIPACVQRDGAPRCVRYVVCDTLCAIRCVRYVVCDTLCATFREIECLLRALHLQG